ncbi:chaperonin 10-like protein [Gongronella butleri]|nr:chaperonin 10-like protein [Gongronella butleri]
MTNDTFHGWACTEAGGPMKWTELPLKQFDSDTVEINVSHCGICGSDISTMDSGWGPTRYPCVVGHEICGTVTRIGDNVTRFAVGDRVGVGAQSGSCLKCDACQSGNEHLCQVGMVGTYNSKWPSGDKAFGGYSDKWRGHQHFVFKVPATMTNDICATFLCAGITTYSPLKRHGVQPGSRVGVRGLGGLGHFAIMWAKAMGAEVVCLSTSERKKPDALALGCTDFVVTTDRATMKKHRNTFTHIIDTTYDQNTSWVTLFSLLKVNSTFILVGIPESTIDGIHAGLLAAKQINFVGSMIGSPAMIEDMLAFADKHKIRPWITKYKMSQVPEAVQAFRDGKTRYRIVLENEAAPLKSKL